MKRKLIFSLLLSAAFCGTNSFAQVIEGYKIPVIGNAFEINHDFKNNTVQRNRVIVSPDTKNATRVYFKVSEPGTSTLSIEVKTKASSKIKVDYLGKSEVIELDANTDKIDLGQYSIGAAGYHYVDVVALKGEVELLNVLLGVNSNTEVIFSNDPNYYYWARRGPSCHLAYTVPTSNDVSYYYNEIVVPKGEDVIGSYYMANGFAEGYFGIQVNSSSERRVLFSVWSPYHTDDPNSIPDDQKIVLLKKGYGVNTGEFGNEGSGGQSFLRYNWKAGQTYKFLLKGEPDRKGNTDYTAWFYAPEDKNWKLIASFKRPKTNTYLKRFHSFLENFDPRQGYLKREVNFGNQWVYDGSWKKVEQATFTVDATYSAKQRVDATGGVRDKGYFFLKMGGFFNDIVQPKSVFKINKSSKSKKPNIDFNKLP